MTIREIVLAEQISWAKKAGKSFHNPHQYPGYLASIDENLYQALSPEARAMFGAGAGGETGTKGAALPHMMALYSSSALVCNLFHPYLNAAGRAPLLSALGLPGEFPSMPSMAFEVKHPVVQGIPPHLDVEFRNDNVAVAIEAKFCEPFYGIGAPKKACQGVYIDRLEKFGRPKCAALARRVGDGRTFSRLDAGQLLKHICGLEKAYGRGYELLYLYYDRGWGDPEAEAQAREHREDIECFIHAIGGEVRVRSVTYQEVFRRLRARGDAAPDHLAYLAGRYFPLEGSGKESEEPADASVLFETFDQSEGKGDPVRYTEEPGSWRAESERATLIVRLDRIEWVREGVYTVHMAFGRPGSPGEEVTYSMEMDVGETTAMPEGPLQDCFELYHQYKDPEALALDLRRQWKIAFLMDRLANILFRSKILETAHLRLDPEPRCSICETLLPDPHFVRNYPRLVCGECAETAVNEAGATPYHDSMGDGGDNPVFIGWIKCWRRYRYGGHITMRDDLDCRDLGEFYDRHGWVG